MFGSFGWMELLLILIIVLIIFGAGKIPQLGEGLGKAIKGFKKSVHEADAIDVTPPPAEQTGGASCSAGSGSTGAASQARITDVRRCASAVKRMKKIHALRFTHDL